MSTNDKPKVVNILAWCKSAERACGNSIANTSVGGWLSDAIAIIRQQHNEIQKARNDLIDATAERKTK